MMLSPLNLVFAEVTSRCSLDRICFVVPESAGPKQIPEALNQKMGCCQLTRLQYLGESLTAMIKGSISNIHEAEPFGLSAHLTAGSGR